MSNKKSDKNPYKKHSLADVMAAEATYFVIQVGPDFFSSEDGIMAFKKEKADHFYEQILAGLTEMRKTGSKIEKEDAIQCLLLLKMYPLRIH